VGTTPTAHRSSVMAENGYGLAGLGMGKVKSNNQYRLTPGFGGFVSCPYVTTECPLTRPYRPYFPCFLFK
ncbi:hypothetical protein, partial [Escherichia coli]|uniref:hypothetical protein n=1 Tax=Escherichia coli TaxID=562 RepID=UPI001BAFE7B3